MPQINDTNEIEIVKTVIRLTKHPSRNYSCELVFIDKKGKEYSPRYYAEYGREIEHLDIEEIKS